MQKIAKIAIMTNLNTRDGERAAVMSLKLELNNTVRKSGGNKKRVEERAAIENERQKLKKEVEKSLEGVVDDKEFRNQMLCRIPPHIRIHPLVLLRVALQLRTHARCQRQHGPSIGSVPLPSYKGRPRAIRRVLTITPTHKTLNPQHMCHVTRSH